jgi:hypothetical protein
MYYRHELFICILLSTVQFSVTEYELLSFLTRHDLLGKVSLSLTSGQNSLFRMDIDSDLPSSELSEISDFNEPVTSEQYELQVNDLEFLDRSANATDIINRLSLADYNCSEYMDKAKYGDPHFVCKISCHVTFWVR